MASLCLRMMPPEAMFGRFLLYPPSSANGDCQISQDGKSTSLCDLGELTASFFLPCVFVYHRPQSSKPTHGEEHKKEKCWHDVYEQAEAAWCRSKMQGEAGIQRCRDTEVEICTVPYSVEINASDC